MKKKIAFICIHNSCRSIMAEGYMRHFASDRFDVYSAGTEVYPNPKPMAIEVMEDDGIDMRHAKSKLIDAIPDRLDILITMGCGVTCPYIPTAYRADWGIEDPSGGPKEDFERARDIIKSKVLELIEQVEHNQLNQEAFVTI
jgi:protein-tyrosine-phosphatase